MTRAPGRGRGPSRSRGGETPTMASTNTPAMRVITPCGTSSPAGAPTTGRRPSNLTRAAAIRYRRDAAFFAQAGSSRHGGDGKVDEHAGVRQLLEPVDFRHQAVAR